MPDSLSCTLAHGDVAVNMTVKLEHNVRHQGAGQIPPLPGVQQKHIEDYDGDALLFR